MCMVVFALEISLWLLHTKSPLSVTFLPQAPTAGLASARIALQCCMIYLFDTWLIEILFSCFLLTSLTCEGWSRTIGSSSWQEKRIWQSVITSPSGKTTTGCSHSAVAALDGYVIMRFFPLSRAIEGTEGVVAVQTILHLSRARKSITQNAIAGWSMSVNCLSVKFQPASISISSTNHQLCSSWTR
jgi:hypothetical protein